MKILTFHKVSDEIEFETNAARSPCMAFVSTSKAVRKQEIQYLY